MDTNMDHTMQLVQHNAELRVELSLVKKQLDQAHKSTTYLLERMSIAGTPRTINTELQQLQKEHEYIVRENAHLKAILGVTREARVPTSRRIGSRTSYGVRTTLRSGRDHSPALTHHHATESAASEQGNLLDLEDDTSPTATVTPAYTTTREPTPPLDSSKEEAGHFSNIPEAVGRPIRRKKVANTSTGLGISGTTSFDSEEAQVSQACSIQHTRPKCGFVTYDSNGNASFFHTPSPTFDSPPKEPRGDRHQPSGPVPFADCEHKRLMGAATYIEDMDEVEEEETWQQQAKNFPRHSVEEYKQYYYETVRPAYLAKQSPKTAEDEVKQEAPKQEATQKQEVELEPLPETSFTSGTINADEILLDDEEKIQIDSSFNTTSSANGGVTVAQVEDVALNKAVVSAEAPSASKSTASAQESESTVRPPSTAAPVINPLSLSMHADPAPTLLQREDPSSTEHGNATIAPEAPLKPTDCPMNPWSFGPAYRDSIKEAKSFAATATPGCQKARPRVNRSEEENAIAPPTPAFGSIAPLTEAGGRPPRRESPPTRCGFSRGYYPMSIKDIFYKPRAEDPNALRTVVISNIPATTTLTQVLDTIRGGRIISSTYHETANFRTTPPVSTNTVTIIFLRGAEAAGFVAHAQTRPITFTTSLLDLPTVAEVTLLKTPTRPISDHLLHRAIPHGLTRILYFHNLPPKLKEAKDIINKIQSIYPEMPRPLTAGYDKDGIMVFEYASMMEVEVAWVIVNEHPQDFPGVVKGFLADPCARAVPKIPFGGKSGESAEEGEKVGEGRDEDGGCGEVELSEGGGEEQCEARKDSVVGGGGGGGDLGEMIYEEAEEDAKMMEG